MKEHHVGRLLPRLRFLFAALHRSHRSEQSFAVRAALRVDLHDEQRVAFDEHPLLLARQAMQVRERVIGGEEEVDGGVDGTREMHERKLRGITLHGICTRCLRIWSSLRFHSISSLHASLVAQHPRRLIDAPIEAAFGMGRQLQKCGELLDSRLTFRQRLRRRSRHRVAFPRVRCCLHENERARDAQRLVRRAAEERGRGAVDRGGKDVGNGGSDRSGGPKRRGAQFIARNLPHTAAAGEEDDWLSWLHEKSPNNRESGGGHVG